jgi:hypothetical protein
MATILANAHAAKHGRVLRPNSMTGLMRRCMPRDRVFSIDELLQLMREAEPDRRFHTMSARAQFHALQREGEVYRVMRSEKRYFLWAAKGFVATAEDHPRPTHRPPSQDRPGASRCQLATGQPAH